MTQPTVGAPSAPAGLKPLKPAGQRFLENPALLQSILQLSDTVTLAQLTRTCRKLYYAAGKELYHGIWVGGMDDPGLVGLGPLINAHKDPSLRRKVLRRSIPAPKYKTHLMGRIKVVTIEGPHDQWCKLPPAVFKYLFRNVNVVRVAPQQSGSSDSRTQEAPGTEYACTRAHCQFMSLPKLHKVVFRNLFSPSLPYPPNAKAKIQTDDLVIVLPTEHQFSAAGTPDAGMDDLWRHVWRVNTIKIVMMPTLETRRWSKPLIPSGDDDNLPLTLGRIAAFSARCDLEVYGLEMVRISRNIPDDEDEEARQCATERMIEYLEDGMDNCRNNADGVGNIKYGTLIDYAEDARPRIYEVEEGDLWDLGLYDETGADVWG
ncbi:hypothetical protein Q8F55_004865 [Vanrija albida]|uniref:F-box domain-containing protein n=1 Tax=Vanrija albida TaxID=181172 RepID=A0ABR3Q014_9TREE